MRKTVLNPCLSLMLALISSCAVTHEQEQKTKSQPIPEKQDNTPKPFDAMLQIQEQGSGTMGTRYKLRMLPIQRYNGQHRYVVQNASITLKYGTRYSASLIFTNMAFSVNQISETDTQILTKQPHNNALHANPISLNWSATGLSEGGLNSITFGFSLRKELTDLLIEEAKNPLHLFVAFHEKGNDTPVFTAAIPMTFEE